MPTLREEAFSAGLLADTGVIMLEQSLPKKYKPILAQYAPMQSWRLCDKELDLLSMTHGDVSALVLQKWMLPEVVVMAVRGYHDMFNHDNESSNQTVQLARIVGAADILSQLLCEKPDEQTLIDRCREAITDLPINQIGLARILEQLQSDISSLAQLLGIDIVESSVYSRAIEIIRNRLMAETVA